MTVPSVGGKGECKASRHCRKCGHWMHRGERCTTDVEVPGGEWGVLPDGEIVREEMECGCIA